MEETTLQAVRDVLTTTLTGSLLALIKDQASRRDRRAGRHLAFDLYRVLDQVAKRSHHFTLTLELYADDVAKKERVSSDEQAFSAKYRRLYSDHSALLHSADYLKESLTELQDILDEIYPQLDVKRPDIVEKIIVYQETRTGTLIELPEIENEAQLSRAVERTKTNHQRIEQIIHAYRSFLDKEFSFKESLEEPFSLIGEVNMETHENINIHEVTESVITIKSNLEHVVQKLDIAKAQTSASQDNIEELKQLIAQLQSAIEPVAQHNPRGAARLAQQVEVVADEVASGTPDKSFLNITAEGLKKAAEAVADVAPTVLSIATKIATFVAAL